MLPPIIPNESQLLKMVSITVVGRDQVAVLDPTGSVDRIFRQYLNVREFDNPSPLQELLGQDVLQLTAFFDADYEKQMLPRMPHCVSGRWHPEFTEGKSNWDKYESLIQGKGAMGKVYPKFLWGVEGDTPSFLHVMPNGLNNPDDPTQAGWGGCHQFGISPDRETYAWTKCVMGNGSAITECNHTAVYKYAAAYHPQ